MQSLKEMVSIESGSHDVEGLNRMAAYTEKRLKALGASVERVPAAQGHGPIVKGTLEGTGRGRILLIAHMDTVYARNTLASQPIREEGNKLYGPGIADDKGGIAVILHALEIMKAQGWKDFARVTVLFNADEEIGSLGSGATIAALLGRSTMSCCPANPIRPRPWPRQNALLARRCRHGVRDDGRPGPRRRMPAPRRSWAAMP